jgi:cytochrome d ubiquinol oxidase subunit II
MLGKYIQGFSTTAGDYAFAIGLAVALVYVYRLLGACWLIAKTSGPLHHKAHAWALDSVYCVAIGFLFVVLCTPEYLFNTPNWSKEALILTALLMGLGACFFIALWRHLVNPKTALHWTPYGLTILMYGCAYISMCIHLYPDIIPGRMTIWEGAASTSSLSIILCGFIVVLPMILSYNILLFYIFKHKTKSTDTYESP